MINAWRFTPLPSSVGDRSGHPPPPDDDPLEVAAAEDAPPEDDATADDADADALEDEDPAAEEEEAAAEDEDAAEDEEDPDVDAADELAADADVEDDAAALEDAAPEDEEEEVDPDDVESLPVQDARQVVTRKVESTWRWMVIRDPWVASRGRVMGWEWVARTLCGGRLQRQRRMQRGIRTDRSRLHGRHCPWLGWRP